MASASRLASLASLTLASRPAACSSITKWFVTSAPPLSRPPPSPPPGPLTELPLPLAPLLRLSSADPLQRLGQESLQPPPNDVHQFRLAQGLALVGVVRVAVRVAVVHLPDRLDAAVAQPRHLRGGDRHPLP